MGGLPGGPARGSVVLVVALDTLLMPWEESLWEGLPGMYNHHHLCLVMSHNYPYSAHKYDLCKEGYRLAMVF